MAPCAPSTQILRRAVVGARPAARADDDDRLGVVGVTARIDWDRYAVGGSVYTRGSRTSAIRLRQERQAGTGPAQGKSLPHKQVVVYNKPPCIKHDYLIDGTVVYRALDRAGVIPAAWRERRANRGAVGNSALRHRSGIPSKTPV